MTHLTPAEFVDAAEGRLGPGRSAHLSACGQCRARAADVRAAWDAAHAADVPEPSPLYWQHFAAHVRQRIAGETIVPWWRAAWRDYLRVRGLMPIASAIAIVVAVFAIGPVSRKAPVALPAGTAFVGTAPAEAVVETEDSEVWQVLTFAAAEVPLEDAHAAGLAVSAGAVDRAVQRMSREELNELGRLLQSEMRRAGD